MLSELSATTCAKYSGTLVIPPPNKIGVGDGGILESPCPSAYPSRLASYCGFVHTERCPSVHPSVDDMVSGVQVCFRISISNFICMLFVAMGRSQFIFSDVTFKMTAWQPYWIFLFLDSNYILALNIKPKIHWHIICVYGKKPIDFQQCHLQMAAWWSYWIFSVSALCRWYYMVSGA